MSSQRQLKSPFFGSMDRIPGGIMIIPLILGAIVNTFWSEALQIGSFTTGLFADSALPLIGLLLFAAGTQLHLKTTGPSVLAHSGVLLLCKTAIPGGIAIALGFAVGLDGIAGISLLALFAAVDNTNSGLWMAYTSKYGDKRDRGAVIGSALNDGPFTTLLFLGASGLGNIPFVALLAAILPLLLGIVVGNFDERWREIMRPTPNIVIPFFAFALGTGIDFNEIITGGMSGILLGFIVAPVTGYFCYLGYKILLKRGAYSGIGFAAGTTAGNAIGTPAVVAAADPQFAQYVGTATAQVAASVLVTAILAPLLASFFLKRSGALAEIKEREAAELELEAERLRAESELDEDPRQAR